jgi:hypothetical protein
MRKSIVAALVAAVALLGAPTGPADALIEPEYRQIHFPTEGAVSFSDDFGDPRSGGRSHEGNDLMGRKMQKLLAAVDGKVTYTRVDAGGLSGNMLTIVDEDGWSYRYIHVNNDTPGTDDNANPTDAIFATGIASGVRVKAGQHVAFLGDSGNAEETAPHLHFEIRRPDGSAINPWTSLRLAQGLPAGTRCAYGTNPKGSPTGKSAGGYWVLGADGGVFSFGAAKFHGSTGNINLNKPIVGIAATPQGDGYWLVATDGGIFAFGGAKFFGSTGAIKLNKPIVGMAATPTGQGYWLVASDGGIFAFGDAVFHGSTGAIKLNRPINGMAVTPSGNGYWLIASDGGMFAFGDATFFGSLPGIGIDSTVVSMSSTKSGKGYWLLAADGGVFSFGDAGFKGSLPGIGLCKWPTGVKLVRTLSGNGYWVQGNDGSTWAFGDAKSFGGVDELGLSGHAPTIDLVPVPPAA